MMNGEDISTFLGKISPLVKQLVQPVTEDLLSQKRKIDPTTQIIYDYEVESFLNSEINPETAEMMRLSQVPGEIIISRSLMEH